MKTGQKAILKKDIVFRKKTWGLKNEEVKIISISGRAVIYERKNGKRYPCKVIDLEEK